VGPLPAGWYGERARTAFQGVTVRLSSPPTLALISVPEPGTGTPPDEQGQQASDERAERDGQGDQAS
jgi:DNA-binding transcriptional regulator PaaX